MLADYPTRPASCNEEEAYMKPFNVFTPRSVSDASLFLEKNQKDARPIAGGTATVIMMKERILAPNYLIDLKKLKHLSYIKFNKVKGLCIGSLTTHRSIETSRAVAENYPALREAFASIGNVRIRNAGTIGGSLAYAEPQCNPPTILAALGAEVVLAGVKGIRRVDAHKFITGIFETKLKPNELITEVRIPRMPSGSSCKFLKFTTRSEEDKPSATIACYLQIDAKHVCSAARLVVGAVGPRIYRCKKSESILIGKRLTNRLLADASEVCTDKIEALDDIYGSPWYKLEISKVLMGRGLHAAWNEIKESQS